MKISVSVYSGDRKAEAQPKTFADNSKDAKMTQMFAFALVPWDAKLRCSRRNNGWRSDAVIMPRSCTVSNRFSVLLMQKINENSEGSQSKKQESSILEEMRSTVACLKTFPYILNCATPEMVWFWSVNWSVWGALYGGEGSTFLHPAKIE